MNILHHALCGCLLACSTLAHADAIVTGTVSVTNPQTGTTTTSGSGSSVSIHANDPSGAFSSIVGNVGPNSGTVVATGQSEFVGPPPNLFATASSNYSLTINGIYMLTGGTGSGLADWTVGGSIVGSGPANWTGCSISIGGATQTCAFTPGTPAVGSFLVPFNTPLDLSFTINYSGFVSFADGQQSTLTYNFDVSHVPEPGTAALLSTGILVIAGIRKKLIQRFSARF